MIVEKIDHGFVVESWAFTHIVAKGMISRNMLGFTDIREVFGNIDERVEGAKCSMTIAWLETIDAFCDRDHFSLCDTGNVF